jgi:AcrR family transcriptional regulator
MFAMHPAYLREKARKLRTERHLSINEIAARLALPKTTIYYWVKDLPLGRPRRANPGQRRGNQAMRSRFKRARDDAYAAGREEFVELAAEPTFRDFVCLYIAEGYKRDRNTVSLCNSDAAVVKLAARWMCRFSRNPVTYRVQYHADQDLEGLASFWAAELGTDPSRIGLVPKSNSNRLSGRTWRSMHGVLAIRTGDTLFRARLQGWIDCLQEQWLDSARSGRGAAW